MEWRPADIAAFVGAGAWVPQIVAWGWRAGQRGRLRVVVGENVHLVHGGMGSGLALNLGASSERKDMLVDRIRAHLIHERGDRRTYSWNFLRETHSEVRNNVGESVEWGRTQTVLALKVTTHSFVERYISFGDDESSRALWDSQGRVRRAFRDAQEIGPVNWETFLQAPVVREARDEFEHSFRWQEGNYRLELHFSMIGSRFIQMEHFRFNLTRQEVDAMRAGMEGWGRFMNAVVGGTELPMWPQVHPTVVAG